MPGSKSCIIVGGGLAGCEVAVNLKKANVDVTIVDKNDYLDWCLASPRSLVAPDDIAKHNFTFPLDKVAEFAGAKFVQSAVSTVSGKSVTLANGETLNADYIVIATGGRYTAPNALWKASKEEDTAEKRTQNFRDKRVEIVSAKSVVVAGAGLTGVEVAGEIKTAFPDKKVTLVGTFLASSPETARKRVRAALQKKGVILVEGRIEQSEPANGKVTTTKGQSFDADILFNCAGFTFGADELLDETIKNDSLTKNGQLSCKDTLQLKGSESVFGCGEIIATPDGCYADVKGSYHAKVTAKTVAKNIVNLSQGKPPSPFSWSKKPLLTSITTLGPDVTVADLGMPAFMNGFQNALGRKLKGKNYFTAINGKGYGKGKTW